MPIAHDYNCLHLGLSDMEKLVTKLIETKLNFDKNLDDVHTLTSLDRVEEIIRHVLFNVIFINLTTFYFGGFKLLLQQL